MNVEDGRVRHGHHGLGGVGQVDVVASPDGAESSGVGRAVGAPVAPGVWRDWARTKKSAWCIVPEALSCAHTLSNLLYVRAERVQVHRSCVYQNTPRENAKKVNREINRQEERTTGDSKTPVFRGCWWR